MIAARKITAAKISAKKITAIKMGVSTDDCTADSIMCTATDGCLATEDGKSIAEYSFLGLDFSFFNNSGYVVTL